ncbi:hypothetical protein Tco_0518172 [Tanacetum coccineum]
MSHSYSNNVLTESYEGAWPEMRRHKFFDNVTADHLEDIMASPVLQERSSNLDSIGHIYSAMHALISDRGTHFCNYQMEKAMKRKLKSRWYEPFSVCKDMKNGAIELYDEDGNKFIVNKQRVKPYQKSVLDTNRDDDVNLDDEGKFTLYLTRRSLEVLRKFHWMILGGRFNQLSHVSSPLFSKPGEY